MYAAAKLFCRRWKKNLTLKQGIQLTTCALRWKRLPASAHAAWPLLCRLTKIPTAADAGQIKGYFGKIPVIMRELSLHILDLAQNSVEPVPVICKLTLMKTKTDILLFPSVTTGAA